MKDTIKLSLVGAPWGGHYSPWFMLVHGVERKGFRNWPNRNDWNDLIFSYLLQSWIPKHPKWVESFHPKKSGVRSFTLLLVVPPLWKYHSIKNWMGLGPYQRTPSVRLPELWKIPRFFRGPWTVGPTVGDFLETMSSETQVERYELQIFEVSSFLRTVLLTGQTTDGRSYQRCVLGNALLVGNLDPWKNPVRFSRWCIKMGWTYQLLYILRGGWWLFWTWFALFIFCPRGED